METKELEKIANNIRLDVLEMVYNAKSGHLGGSFSIAELLAFLYFEQTNICEDNLLLKNRDKVVLSKGHAVAALYAVLSQKGLLKGDLESFRKFGSSLQGHPDMRKEPGVDYTTGSLGQGLSICVGMALAKKLAGDVSNVYCILGDGEIEEGQVYEAVNVAMKYKLDNLYILVDNNRFQLDGDIESIGGITNIANIFKGFGLDVVCVDGHNIDEIRIGFDVAKKQQKPKCIVFETVKGKGVSFMENSHLWHGKCPNEEQYIQAKKELEGKGID